MILNGKERTSKKPNKPQCVDLFAGAGGLTLGFFLAGGTPIAAVDNHKDSMATYKKMFPMVKETFLGNIEEWIPQMQLNDLDAVIGGPPCQGFSLARGLRFVDDPRNRLYKYFVDFVKKFQPKWFVMENVQGITNIGKGSILREIYQDFSDIGYVIDHRVINMADYGVPQKRKRAIFVGNRLNREFIWPNPTHIPRTKKQPLLLDSINEYVTVFDALSDLPWPMGNYFSHRANSKMRGPRNRNVYTEPAFTLRVRGDEFALCEHPAEGAFSPDPLPDVDFSYRPIANEFRMLMREDAPSWIENTTIPIVNDPPKTLKGTRRLSVREQARLQSFPDWFEFAGTPYNQSRQIGNAVPPLFAKKLFLSIFQQS